MLDCSRAHPATWGVQFLKSRRRSTLRTLVAERPGMRIAEVGCGTGATLRMFRRSKLTAIDASSAFLEEARRNLADCDADFIQGELASLNPLPAGFDRVVCTEMIEHAEEPSALLSLLRRMLAPGGRAIISIPHDQLIDGLKTAVRVSPAGWVGHRYLEWGGEHLARHRWTASGFHRLLSEQFVVERRAPVPAAWLPTGSCFLCVAKP